jgi:putative ATPase
VPTHLRDAHYRSASTIGHGEGYAYPHDHPGAWVDQEYRPASVAGNVYYEPSDRGHEAVVAERQRRRRADATDGAGGDGSAGEGDPDDDDPTRTGP